MDEQRTTHHTLPLSASGRCSMRGHCCRVNFITRFDPRPHRGSHAECSRATKRHGLHWTQIRTNCHRTSFGACVERGKFIRSEFLSLVASGFLQQTLIQCKNALSIHTTTLSLFCSTIDCDLEPLRQMSSKFFRGIFSFSMLDLVHKRAN